MAAMSELKRTLGLTMLTFYGTGMILGAGIYSVIGKAAGTANDTLWISFLLGAVSTLLTALSYAELSALFPKAGAEYIFLTKAFHRKSWIGSTIGVAVALSGAATAATVAIAFSGYLKQFFEFDPFVVSAALLIFFTVIAILGTHLSAWANVIFTVIEIAGLGLIIYLGFQSKTFGDALSVKPHLGTLSAAALIVFAFFGFENVVNLSEEAKNPKKDIPRAIIISVLICSALYVLVGFAALSLVNSKQLAESSAPLMLVAQSVSENFGKILGIVALFSTANTALISMMGASRILFGMAKTKVLPTAIAKVHEKRNTPWVAALIILFLALTLLNLTKIEIVASISAFATLIAFIAVNVALIYLRFTQSSLARPFRVPLNIRKVPVPAALAIVFSLVFITQFQFIVYVITGLILALSAVIFYFHAISQPD